MRGRLRSRHVDVDMLGVRGGERLRVPVLMHERRGRVDLVGWHYGRLGGALAHLQRLSWQHLW